MFNKIWDFYIDYEEFINLLLLLICFIFFVSIIVFFFDKQLTIEKNIIENTKEYVVFDNCKRIENKYYCWESDLSYD